MLWRNSINMKSSILLIIIALLSGCSTFIDRSGESEYKDILGEKTLMADALLCKSEPKSMKDATLYDTKIVWQKVDPECIFGSTVVKLPKGTSVSVNQIEEHIHRNLFYFERWYLLGQVSANGKVYKFYHFYGFSGFPKIPEWQ